MSQVLKTHIKNKLIGAIAVETALGMFLLMGIILCCMEVSYMGFTSAVMNYAAAESSRAARTVPCSDYKKVFKTTLQASDALWSYFLDIEKLTVETFYYPNITTLLMNDQCGKTRKAFCSASTKPTANAIAIYRVSYPYQPLFVGLFSRHAQIPALSREVIAIQEYERDGTP